MRVLVVDDEPVIRMTIAAALDDMDVLEAGDGVEALDSLSGNDVDLVILDIGLPGASGIEVLGHLREQPSTAELPVIVVTARGREEDHVRGFSAGADAYITKPFSFDELVDTARFVTGLTPQQRAALRARELERAQTLLSLEGLLG